LYDLPVLAVEVVGAVFGRFEQLTLFLNQLQLEELAERAVRGGPDEDHFDVPVRVWFGFKILPHVFHLLDAKS